MMTRRIFLLAILVFPAGFFGNAKPALALFQLLRIVAAGIRLFRAAGVASRGAATFSRGLPLSRAVARPRVSARPPAAGRGPSSGGLRTPGASRGGTSRSTFGSTRTLSTTERTQLEREIHTAASAVDPDLVQGDRRRLRANLWELIDKVSDVMDMNDALHFVSQWADDNDWTVLETRLHIGECPACNRAYVTLTRGTTIEVVPIVEDPGSTRDRRRPAYETFSEEVTVLAEIPGLDPKRRLRLPQVPTSLRASVSGKEITVHARVDRQGQASIVSVDSAGISSFIVARAEDMVVNTPWEPARDRAGRPINGLVRVIFRWD
jgi:hypothetical protein